MTASTRVEERRHRTLDDIVRTALEVMDQTGAAGLSLGEVAKRMGMRTPSLYGYVPSKDALVDELFARGWRAAGDVVRANLADVATVAAPGVRDLLAESALAFVTWALENRALAEVMFWRPLPGWEPSAAAYEPARDALEVMAIALATLRDRDLLAPDADILEMTDVFVLLVTGVISQQLANEPGVDAPAGRFVARLPRLTDMFADRYLVREGDRS
jgi:AcrR family transcriptional regulator